MKIHFFFVLISILILIIILCLLILKKEKLFDSNNLINRDQLQSKISEIENAIAILNDKDFG